MTALAWSGGKDSTLALHALGDEVEALLTTVVEGSGRVTVHGVPGELVRRQAEALGLPLVSIAIPDPCPDGEYAARMSAALAEPPLLDADVAFGDLFLEDVRAFREARLAEAGRAGRFPLWGRPTDDLAVEFVGLGFAATVVSVDRQALDASFLGRAYDAALLADLPADVDPCGENGEFHTFVHDGPLFSAPIAHRQGAARIGGRFAHLELVAS